MMHHLKSLFILNHHYFPPEFHCINIFLSLAVPMLDLLLSISPIFIIRLCFIYDLFICILWILSSILSLLCYILWLLLYFNDLCCTLFVLESNETNSPSLYSTLSASTYLSYHNFAAGSNQLVSIPSIIFISNYIIFINILNINLYLILIFFLSLFLFIFIILYINYYLNFHGNWK
jgi:hypothetical protein